MAFVKIEDRTAEAEVIVFTKLYEQFAAVLHEDNAVMIEGTLSFEDGDTVRIILSKAIPLISNDDFSPLSGESIRPERIYIKMASVTDYAVNKNCRKQGTCIGQKLSNPSLKALKQGDKSGNERATDFDSVCNPRAKRGL